MALFSFFVSLIKRSEGQSALAASAYQTRSQLLNTVTGKKTRNFENIGGLSEDPFILAPEGTPAWAKNRQKLWDEVEKEKRRNAQLARSLIIALPHELTPRQRKLLLVNFLREGFISRGMIADVALHEPDPKGDQRNFHAHVLLTMRKIVGGVFSKNKTREWNEQSLVPKWRALWSKHVVNALSKEGFYKEAEEFKDAHLSLEEQRRRAIKAGDLERATTLSRAPTTHLGPKIVAVRRRGLNKPPDATEDVPIIQADESQQAPNDLGARNVGAPPILAETLENVPAPEGERSSRWRDETERQAIRDISHVWKTTTTAEDFVSAIGMHGYELRKGRSRDFIVVRGDKYYNLVRLVSDPIPDANGVMRSTVRTADVRSRLGSIEHTLSSFRETAEEVTVTSSESDDVAPRIPRRERGGRRPRRRSHG